MTKTSEEIKNRLSNIGEAIGVIALEYIDELERKIEKMKCCSNCNGRFLSSRCGLCINKNKWELAE